MKFGLDLTIFGELADPVLLGDLAVAAEQAGWDGFFLWDHVASAYAPEVTTPGSSSLPSPCARADCGSGRWSHPWPDDA
jgi:alkanesulfonate monooxygenase SsuD/methylene tetrahydromethanopterin reductase-like flavin-dependent oxidoreductase (luciferase family)